MPSDILPQSGIIDLSTEVCVECRILLVCVVDPLVDHFQRVLAVVQNLLHLSLFVGEVATAQRDACALQSVDFLDTLLIVIDLLHLLIILLLNLFLFDRPLHEVTSLVEPHDDGDVRNEDRARFELMTDSVDDLLVRGGVCASDILRFDLVHGHHEPLERSHVKLNILRSSCRFVPQARHERLKELHDDSVAVLLEVLIGLLDQLRSDLSLSLLKISLIIDLEILKLINLFLQLNTVFLEDLNGLVDVLDGAVVAATTEDGGLHGQLCLPVGLPLEHFMSALEYLLMSGEIFHFGQEAGAVVRAPLLGKIHEFFLAHLVESSLHLSHVDRCSCGGFHRR